MSKLEKNNQIIQTLYHNIPGGIFLCLYDADLTLLEINDGFLAMIGHVREELFDDGRGTLRSFIEPKEYIEIQRTIKDQLAEGTELEFQCRLMQKEGHWRDVLIKATYGTDEQDRPVLYGVMLDITKQKIVEDDLKSNLERFQIIVDQTNDVIFEWNLANDSLLVTDNWEKKIGKRNFKKGECLSNMLAEDKLLPFAPEDLNVIRDCIWQLRGGKPYIEEVVRVSNGDGEEIWCRIRATQYFDEGGMPTKVVGIIMDIDREMRHSQNLQKKADQDALTNLYNKIATQSLIREYLKKPDVSGTLMLIDIDDFKQVNDTLGHLYGDTVLCTLSRNLMKSFRDTDVLGRIGGDEFLIFLKGVGASEAAQNGKRVLQIFNQTQGNDQTHWKLSCSIGIAFYPEDGQDFVSLYQKADCALYHAKHGGKNRYEFFKESNMKTYLNDQLRPSTFLNAQIDSNMESRIMNAEIVEYVFRILYTTHDIFEGISSILGIVGNYFDISRVYIFENSQDHRFCSNTYEWCNKDILPKKDNLQKLSYKGVINGYLDNFDEKNIFYCTDIKQLPKSQYELLESQNIKSLLQCGIYDQGIIKGFVGFDECHENRSWTQDQIDVLVFISNIIATFLLKARAVERYEVDKINTL